MHETVKPVQRTRASRYDKLSLPVDRLSRTTLLAGIHPTIDGMARPTYVVVTAVILQPHNSSCKDNQHQKFYSHDVLLYE